MFITTEEEQILQLSAGVENEPSEVFYTDENPTFELRIKNLMHIPVEGTIQWHLDIGEGRHRILKNEDIWIDSDSEEVRTLTPSLLGIQDSGHVAAKIPNNQEVKAEDGVIQLPKGTSTTPLYTFSVWDRDFYRANYIWPRRAQYFAALLSIGIILVGVLQLL